MTPRTAFDVEKREKEKSLFFFLLSFRELYRLYALTIRSWGRCTAKPHLETQNCSVKKFCLTSEVGRGFCPRLSLASDRGESSLARKTKISAQKKKRHLLLGSPWALAAWLCEMEQEPENTRAFRIINLNLGHDSFNIFQEGVVLDPLGKGRWGSVLTWCNDKSASLVRTTTRYEHAAQPFTAAHLALMKQLEAETGLLNNALIEMYDNGYRKMGYHSDQALDLADKSFIVLVSCYENASTDPCDIRKLVVQNKATGNVEEFLLTHNSAIIFSTAANCRHKHKIILDAKGNAKNRWLGLTFRRSNMIVEFDHAGVPHLSDGRPLRMASDAEVRDFCKLKGAENTHIGPYTYPNLDFTMSPSDLMAPKQRV